MKKIGLQGFVFALSILLLFGSSVRGATEATTAEPKSPKSFQPGDQQNPKVFLTTPHLFTTERIVRLQEHPDYPVGLVREVEIIGDKLFIDDKLQLHVFMFTLDGQFIKPLARHGSGPGEYQRPYDIERVWGNHLAVYDANLPRILVYDGLGKLVRELGRREHLLPYGALIWPTPQQFYAIDSRFTDPTQPWHQLLDWSEDPPRVLRGFGGPNPAKKPHERFGAAQVCHGFLWLSSPYEAGRVDIRDLQGRPACSFQLRADFSALQLPDRFNVTSSAVVQFHELGAYILCEAGNNRLYLFDQKVNNVAAVRLKGFNTVLTTLTDRIVFQRELPDADLPVPQIEQALQHDLTHLENAGFVRANLADDDGIYIKFMRLDVRRL